MAGITGAVTALSTGRDVSRKTESRHATRPWLDSVSSVRLIDERGLVNVIQTRAYAEAAYGGLDESREPRPDACRPLTVDRARVAAATAITFD